METGAAKDDAQLVEEIQQGETAAEAALYTKYSGRIYYFALSELRCHTLAEDVRSETMLRVLQAIRGQRLRSIGALPSFILTTAYNVMRELVRQERRTEQLLDYEVGDGGKFERETILRDPNIKVSIERVIRRLKPREQEFLRMYYYDELPSREIAERLGIKEERVRLIKSRALKRFRLIYERLGK